MQDEQDTPRDRSSSFVPIHSAPPASEERVWLKAAVILTVMFVFGLSLLRLAGLIA
ncbi:hypothetical protein [Variovorax sp. Sphag1AA]|uniref:hypothetical protein n=1 Tax=Variovorax sp. Sphag1AA TaxID=2587027 RepID=UPI00161B923C|nr:hypothetical protein [Variovorax sp. Sphag1AA]MBB3176650.1 hypothetical protein [Variovorax sp. Sphag1AA]